jgi:hypothetical protein
MATEQKHVDIEQAVDYLGMGQWQQGLCEMGDATEVLITGATPEEAEAAVILNLALNAAIASLQNAEAICGLLFEHRM